MRLLNARTLQFEDDPEKYGEYAILSHVWQKGEEVSFQDMQQGTGTSKSGYQKIVNTCREALKEKLEYVWIDTCCIDKSSSAELSEAINSMYRWYYEADVCYAYMGDVLEGGFETSRWFTRGWTLQELIAPSHVHFYDSQWERIGTRRGLADRIAELTRIHVEVLLDRRKRSSISIAARMSWAAHRRTTRIEDRAYSLMGIFDVNMPMLYGEGWKAFRRLQEEIMRNSTDHSILAWEHWDNRQANELLAPSPYAFRRSGDIVSCSTSGVDESFILSNKGLRITLASLGTDEEDPTDRNEFFAILNCHYTENARRPIALLLHRHPQPKTVPARKIDTIVCELSSPQTGDGRQTRTHIVRWRSLPRAVWLDLMILQEPPNQSRKIRASLSS